MNLRKIHIIIIILLALSSCKVRTDSGGSPEEGHISIVRYDRLLTEYVTFNSTSALQKLNTEHKHITKLLIEDVLSIGHVSEDRINEKLKAFYSDTTLLRVMNDIENRFPDLSDIEKELSKGFKNLHKEAPSIIIPQVYTQISALNESIVVGDSLLGISLDKYMGEEYPVYTNYFYDFQLKSMHPERIPSDCFVFYLLSEYPFPIEIGHNLLNVIIHYGKINYIVKELLGYSSVDRVMGYTEDESKWLLENRQKIWNYMVQTHHIHLRDPMLIRRYTGTVPYISQFGEDAPVQVGIWIGSQIVSAYMKNNKKTTILDLLRMTDYSRMVEHTGYKP